MRGVRYAVAALSLLALAGCRDVLPTRSWLQPRSSPLRNPSTADARKNFDHRSHQRVFGRHAVACVDCHQFALRIETEDVELARALSAIATYPGSEACHPCHLTGENRLADAPSRCRTCHTNLWPLLPEDHHANWERAHAVAAHIDARSCEDCHRPQECADCHARRDTIDTRVHERSFRFFHSVQARANPMECGSCHRVDFCIHCHEQSAPEAWR